MKVHMFNNLDELNEFLESQSHDNFYVNIKHTKAGDDVYYVIEKTKGSHSFGGDKFEKSSPY